ncbi:MAG: cell division protein DivIVA [Evtepia sp.]|jgi:cell division initiation protein|nr:cell division protein DivIVA [Evtepia sp.]
MMTPQEAESRVFSKASFGGGYNMAQVDTFLDTLISDYTALYKENAALKSKMKVLVDKIEEYRATEDAMRRTLLSAQKMADSMVKEAETKKADAITKAEGEAKRRIEEIRREMNNEEMRLTAARNSTTAYVNKLKELYTRELEYIGRLAEMTLTPSAKTQESDPVREIEENVSEMMIATQTEDPPEITGDATTAVQEPVGSLAPEEQGVQMEASEQSDTVVFDRLQFGKDYQFK